MYLPEEAVTVQPCEEKTQGHLIHCINTSQDRGLSFSIDAQLTGQDARR